MGGEAPTIRGWHSDLMGCCAGRPTTHTGDNVTKQIEGVPESITRQQYKDLLRQLGLDPHYLYGLVFERDAIIATVKALNENGQGYIAERNELAKHIIAIKVVDE